MRSLTGVSTRALACLVALAPDAAGAGASGVEPAAASQPADLGDDAERGAATADSGPRFQTTVVSKREPEDPFLSERSVSVRDRQDLDETAPRTTPEALWDAPGVFVQQTNHGGGSPIVRGMIGPQVLMLVDGVRLNNSVYRTGPLQYLNLIDPLSLDQIEVLRGPGSVLYGSDAMGGVIALSTLRLPTPDALEGGGQLLLRYGSASREKTLHSHARAGYAGAGVLAGATYKHFDDLVAGRDVGAQLYSGYQHASALAKASWAPQLGALGQLQLDLGYLMARVADAGRTDKLFDKRSLQVYDNDDDLLYARAGLALQPLHTRATLTLSYQRFFERKDTIAVEEDLATEVSALRDETSAHTLGADLQAATRLLDARLRLHTGALWYRDLVDATQQRRERERAWEGSGQLAYPPGSTYDNLGLYALVEGDPLRTPGGHMLRLGGGYRLHGMRGAVPERDDLPAVEFFHLGHVFSASAQYLLRDLATVALTFSQGFRAPNLQEAMMLGDTGKFFHIPNDALGPERSDTFELVARARLGRLTLSGSGYASLLHDLIKRVDAQWQGQAEVGAKPVAQNVNGQEGLLWGAEAAARLALFWGLSLHGHATYTFGEELIDGGDSVPLTRIPPLFGLAALRYDLPVSPDWHLFAETYIRAAAAQERLSPEDESDARIPEGGTPGWWTWNLRAGALVQKRVRVSLVLENLLDEVYRYHGSGVYAPGTNGVVALELLY